MEQNKENETNEHSELDESQINENIDSKDKIILYYATKLKNYTITSISNLTGISKATVSRRLKNPYLRLLIDKKIDDITSDAIETFKKSESEAALKVVSLMRSSHDPKIQLDAAKVILNDYLKNINVKHKGFVETNMTIEKVNEILDDLGIK